MIKKPSPRTRIIFSILFFFLLSLFYGYGQDNLSLREKLEVRDKFNIAAGFYNRKSYAISIPYFLEVLKKDSNHFFARYYLGLAFFRIGKTDEAIREMENLVRIGGLNRSLENKINFFSQQKFIDSVKKKFNRYVWIRDYPDRETSLGSWASSLNPFNLLLKQGYQVATPIHLRITPNNELLVLDFSLKNLLQLDGDGVYLGNKYQSLNLANSQNSLTGPWAFVESGGRFWVTDFLEDNIKVIGKDGSVEMAFGSKGIGETNFLGIKGITADENGNFYIADSGNGRVQFRNQRGEWLKNIGYRGDDLAGLLNPIDVAYDQQNRELYVLDKGNKKVVRFSAEGQFLSVLPGTQSLNNPQKMTLDTPTRPEDLYILDVDSLHRYRLEPSRMETIELQNENPSPQFSSFAFGEDGYLYLGTPLKKKVEIYAPVEKTYANLPVLFGAIDTGRFPRIRAEVVVKDLSGHAVKFLQGRNFNLKENNIPIPFKLLPSPQSRRITLLVEKSSLAQDRAYTINAFMEEVFNQLSGQEGVKVITYNQNGHTEQTPFTLFKLAAIEKATANDYTPKFIANGALQSALVNFKDSDFKNAVVMLVFSPHEAAHFQGRYTEVLQAIKNNDIPVYVFYAGPNTDNNLYYLRNLTRQTGGRFYTYEEKVLSRFESDLQNFHNGVYHLEYITTSSTRNRGVFRRVGVTVQYKNSQGEDTVAGYTLP